jgi:hypothetical protein
VWLSNPWVKRSRLSMSAKKVCIREDATSDWEVVAGGYLLAAAALSRARLKRLLEIAFAKLPL